MKCFKCESTTLGSRSFILRELAKGSPTKGKNKKYVSIKVEVIFCKDCQSESRSYTDVKGD